MGKEKTQKREAMMKNFKTIGIILILLISIGMFYQCATNPVTGKKELMLFSEAAEINMGREVDQGLKAEYGIYYDPDLNNYIANIGRKLAAFSHRPNLKYHFAVLDTGIENAFAAPGGYIYITRGLLAMINSEAELAAVIGHELGHVNARHSVRSLSRNILFTLGLVVASELSEDIRDIAPIANIATQLLFLKYSRSDEYQADSLGIEYATMGGYQAGVMVDFFNSLMRLSKESGAGHLPNFLSTHPLTPKRIARVNQLLGSVDYKKMVKSKPKLMVKKSPYLGRINGLVFGKNPRQGYVKGNAFYHPEMKFLFQVPRGWQVQNTPKKVTMASKDGKALMILTAVKGNANLENHVNTQLKSLSEPTVVNQGYITINGLRAYQKLVKAIITDDAGKKKEKIRVRVTGIKKNGMIYNFFAAAEPGMYGSYKNEFNRTISSFKNLRASGPLSQKPARVYVRKNNRTQSFRDFLVAHKVNPNYWKRVALINSVQLDSRIQSGQSIKIIR